MTTDYTRTDNRSSDEIKADIEQTRGQMGAKLDALQEKLDPNRLVDQAQESVRTALNDTANQFTSYVRENRDELGQAMMDSIKRNPLPAALIGVGLGWLLVEGLRGPQEERPQHYRSSRASGYRYEGEGYQEQGYPSYNRYQQQGYPDYPAQGYRTPGSSYMPGEFEQQGHQGEGIKDKAASMVDTVKDKASGAVEAVGDAAKEAAIAAKDAVTGAVSSATGAVADRAREMGGAASDEMSYRRQMVGDAAHEARSRAEDMAVRAGRQVQYTMEDNTLLFGLAAFAAGAFVGAILPQTRIENRMMGETRDEFMQSAKQAASDVAQRAQGVIEEVRPEVEQTAKQLAGDLKEAGKSAMEEVKSSASTAAAQIKESATHAKDAAKSEAQSALRDSGIQTGGSQSGSTMQSSATKQTGGSQSSGSQTGNMANVNRDVVKGKWSQFKGDLKQKWGKLTDDDLMQIEGSYDKLTGKLQERYGWSKADAEQKLNQYIGDWKA